MSRRRSSLCQRSVHNSYDSNDLARLWALRLLVQGQLWRRLGSQYSIDADILRLVGLGEYVDERPSTEELYAALRVELNEAVKTVPRRPKPLAQNLQALARTIGLSELDCDVLALTVFCEGQKGVQEVFDLASSVPGQNQMANLISIALDQPVSTVRRALAFDSPLRRSGLLQPVEDAGEPLQIADGIADLLLYRSDASDELLRRYSLVNQPCELDLSAYEHVAEQVDQLRRYITRAGQRGRSGANVLIYGEPGTGKTELVRALSKSVGAQLHEIRYADHRDLPIFGDHRFAAYRFCQRMLAPSLNTFILFDEVEDVFGQGASRGRKAWVNRVLEDNPRPAFWLSNDISCMDPAFIRRFDIILRMPELTEAIRLRIARQLLRGLNVSEGWLARLTARPGLQPAHLSKAAKVVRTLGLRRGERVESTLDGILNGLLEALGHPSEKTERPRPTTLTFSPQLVNTDHDLSALADGMCRSGMGRLCLYGPPGTGKSAFVQYLALKLGVPLLSRKASDLLGTYVGSSEKNLAAAFAEATEQGAVLLIDEADSFLRTREDARQRWEVSQVNELLVQMEQYEGILVMATNHMQMLDSAAMRRFDFKIRFGPLKPDQALTFCRVTLSEAECEMEEAELTQAIANLELTPGDFATVTRRFRVLGHPLTATGLVAGLTEECRLRQARVGRPIGFMPVRGVA